MLEQKTDPRVLEDAVEVLMLDEDGRMVTVRVTREALEDYYVNRSLTPGSLSIMFSGRAYKDIIAAAERLYDRNEGRRATRIVVTSKILNG